MNLMDDIKNELNSELQTTENGALGYSTSKSALVDLNFMASSMRNMPNEEIYNHFIKAYAEDNLRAIKWLFFLRDREQGMGERNSFRVILSQFAKGHPSEVQKLLSLIPEYGRWDDIFCLLEDDELRGAVLNLIYNQIALDKSSMANGQSISLLGKWLPSPTSKKDKNRMYASFIRKSMGLDLKGYRALCKELRTYLDVVERKMSNKQWDQINYNNVPSKANLIYSNAFLRNDNERRNEYLNKLKNKDESVKINAGKLFPYEIIHKYSGDWWFTTKNLDDSIELLWDNLPKTVPEDSSAIVVADTSGSMWRTVGLSTVTAYEVCESLAIYMSQYLKGEYKDKAILFSNRPHYIDMSNLNSLHDKIEFYNSYCDVNNTDIKKVFDLILDVAIKNEYKQEDLPKNIIICSDMEFDNACINSYNVALFENIKTEYAKHGYLLPKLVFWNICSRTNTIPLQENELGVTLVSGFSQNIMDMVMSTELDPYKALINKLDSDRYKSVEEALNG